MTSVDRLPEVFHLRGFWVLRTDLVVIVKQDVLAIGEQGVARDQLKMKFGQELFFNCRRMGALMVERSRGGPAHQRNPPTGSRRLYCEVLVVELACDVILTAEGGELLFLRLKHFAQGTAVLAEIVAAAILSPEVCYWDQARRRHGRQETAALCMDGSGVVPYDFEEFGHARLSPSPGN